MLKVQAYRKSEYQTAKILPPNFKLANPPLCTRTPGNFGNETGNGERKFRGGTTAGPINIPQIGSILCHVHLENVSRLYERFLRLACEFEARPSSAGGAGGVGYSSTPSSRAPLHVSVFRLARVRIADYFGAARVYAAPLLRPCSLLGAAPRRSDAPSNFNEFVLYVIAAESCIDVETSTTNWIFKRSVRDRGTVSPTPRRDTEILLSAIYEADRRLSTRLFDSRLRVDAISERAEPWTS